MLNKDLKIQLEKIVLKLGWVNVWIELVNPHNNFTVINSIRQATLLNTKKEAKVINIKDAELQETSSNVAKINIQSYCSTESIYVDVVHVKIQEDTLQILKSAQSILERCKPDVVAEYETKTADKKVFYTAINFLSGLKYKGFFELETVRIPLRNFDFAIYQNPLSNFTCNTFVFQQG